MTKPDISLSAEQRDCHQEIANIAMGQAADRLARLLDAYVLLPIPKVNLMEANDLSMALANSLNSPENFTICQGFVGSGVSGEILLFFNDVSFDELANLLGYQHNDELHIKGELLMDASSVLAGSCLQGLGEQLSIQFIQNHPIIISKDNLEETATKANAPLWHKTLTIEFHYSLEHLSIDCDVLLIFSESAVAQLHKKIDFLLE